jgi:hypothetical protein
MTDFLFPTISSPKQSIVSQLFSRTILVGQEVCQISHSDLARLTGLTIITVRKAIRELIEDKFIEVIGEHKPKSASTYKLNIPTNIPQTLKIQRNPYLLFKETSKEAGKETYKLTPEGKGLLNTIKTSLSPSETNDIYIIAKKEIANTNINLEDKVDEIVIRRYFSEDKKRKYCFILQRTEYADNLRT